MKNIAYSIVVGVLLISICVSCKEKSNRNNDLKSSETKKVEKQESPTKQDHQNDDVEPILLAKILPASPYSHSNTTEEYNCLGYGYDVLGAYADASFAKEKVINVEKLAQNEPERLYQGRILQKSSRVILGDNYADYLSKLNKRVALFKFSDIRSGKMPFENTFYWAFNVKDKSYESYSYASSDLLLMFKRFTIYADYSDIRERYLSESFRADCEKLSASNLVSKYGTHVLRNICTGGQLRLVFRSQIERDDKDDALSLGLIECMKQLFQVEMWGKGGLDMSLLYQNKNVEISYRTVGGDPKKQIFSKQKEEIKIGDKLIDITPWLSSLNEQTAQLIEIGEDGLIPLYLLVPQEQKRKELMEYMASQHLLMNNEE